MTDRGGRTDDRRADGVRYRWVQAATTGMLLLAFAIGSAVQANLLRLIGESVPETATIGVAERLVANLAASAVLMACIVAIPTLGRGWPAKLLLLTGFGLLGLSCRSIIQLALGVHDPDRLDLLLLDAIAPAVTGTISLVVGLVAAETNHALRVQERINAHQAIRAATALQLLQEEELRVRRAVAEGLHGSVQQHLVLVEAQLRHLRDRLGPGRRATAGDLQLLDALHGEVERMREHDVRGYSQLLYPSGVDMGLAQAIRVLFRRLSSTIAVSLRIDDSVVHADDPASSLPVPLRILAIRVLEEGITNALRHGHAGTLAAEIRVDGARRLHMVLDDDGTGALPSSETDWSGLSRLRQLLLDYNGDLRLGRSPLGGVRLSTSLDLPPAGADVGLP